MLRKEWKWFGLAGHFCGARECRYHLCTQVGDFLISTVGAYFPGNTETMQEIGCGRQFETMVFKAGEPCSEIGCMCGQPRIDGCGIDMKGYNTAGEAQEGHMLMCNKFAHENPELIE